MSKVKMLALDFGSSGGKAFVGLLENKKLTLTEVYRFPNDAVIINGNFYWDILRLFHEIKISIQKCYLLGHNDISAIGIDTWGVDFGLIDEYGHLIDNPRHIRDMLKKDSVKEVLDVVPAEELYEETGASIRWTNSLMQLHSLNKHCVNKVKSARTLLLLPDLLNYFLTGVKKSDYSIASSTQMLNIHTKKWDEKILKKLKLPYDILPELIKPGTVIGALTDSVANSFGVAKHNVVAVAGHDTECAFAAVPAIGNDHISISCGTWALVGIEVDEPILTKQSADQEFTNEQCIDGRIMHHKIINGLWLIQECRKEWVKNGNEINYNELEEAAAKVDPLKCIINPNYQLFEEEGNIVNKIKDFCIKTKQSVPEKMQEVYVCVLQSLALEFKSTIEQAQENLGRIFKKVYVVGGGSQSNILCQFIADATGKPVVAGPSEATAIGNILIQGLALGEISDSDEIRSIVKQSFETIEYNPKNEKNWNNASKKYKDYCKIK